MMNLVKSSVSKDGNLTSCINCADPPCMTYNKDEVFNAVDSLASRVCPDNLIQIDSDGIMTDRRIKMYWLYDLC